MFAKCTTAICTPQTMLCTQTSEWVSLFSKYTQESRQRPTWEHARTQMHKMGQCLARATMLHCIQTTMDKHFLTAFSQDPGCTLRGTVHLLKATPEPKQKEKKKKKLTQYYIAGNSFIYSCSSTLSNTMPAIRRVIIKSVRLAKAVFHWAETSYYTANEIV